MKMQNKVAIVTGGVQGIGLAVAERFLAEGAKVVLADINEEKGRQVEDRLSASGSAAFFKTDVSKVSDIEALVDFTVKKFGTVDIVVNNAGILHNTKIADITEAEWDRMFAINTKGMFFLIQKTLPYMTEKGYGRIINMSSLAGRMGGYKNGVGYSATKAAIIGLTMGIARRIAETGVTCNAIAPGTTESDIIAKFTPAEIDNLRETIPMKRLGKTTDIAAAVAFLASEEAGFITGAVLDVNGGMFMG